VSHLFAILDIDMTMALRFPVMEIIWQLQELRNESLKKIGYFLCLFGSCSYLAY